MNKCAYCFGPLTEKGRGRIPVFCSNSHRQAHYRLGKTGSHIVADKNRHQSRIKALRNATGADLNQGQPLRNAGSFSQVDWTEEN